MSVFILDRNSIFSIATYICKEKEITKPQDFIDIADNLEKMNYKAFNLSYGLNEPRLPLTEVHRIFEHKTQVYKRIRCLLYQCSIIQKDKEYMKLKKIADELAEEIVMKSVDYKISEWR